MPQSGSGHVRYLLFVTAHAIGSACKDKVYTKFLVLILYCFYNNALTIKTCGTKESYMITGVATVTL